MIPVILLLTVLLLSLALFGVMELRLRRQGYDGRRTPPTVHVHHRFDPANSAGLKGGSRIGRWNASVPLITLSIDEEFAHLSGLRPVWIPRDRVEHVERIRGTFGSGIRFQSRNGDFDGVVFWTFDPETVLAAFGSLGWDTA